MANISFGQNILPKVNNTYSLGNSSYKWHAYLADINGQAIEDLVLPAVTSSDNDKILKVSSGEWTVGDAPSGLPTVSSTDNGKILSVSSGEWAAITPSYLTSHQDISGKADKVTNAVAGNVVTLDANGNLVDSDKTLGVSVPNDAVFTDTTYSNATTSTHGLMSVEDKVKLDNINEIQIDKTIDTPAAIMSFSDGADGLPMALTVGIDPVQDLHGYDNPWPAGGGKNLLDLSSISTGTTNEVTYTVYKNDEGAVIRVHAEGTASSTSVRQFIISLSFPFDVIVSGSGTNATFDCNGGTYTENTIIPANTEITNIRFRVGSGKTVNTDLYPMLRKATETDATFAPYSNICPITGWTGAKVANISDSEKQPYFAGLLNGTYGFVDLGTLNWNKDISGGNVGFYASALSGAKSPLSWAIPFNAISKYFVTVPADGYSQYTVDKTIFMKSNGQMFAVDNAYKDATTFKTAMSGIHLIYELATPTTPTITREQFDALLAEFGISGQTYPITFPSSAGTVYGGTLTVNKDGSGELVVDRAEVDLGSLTWIYSGADLRFYTVELSNMKTEPNGSFVHGISSMYTSYPYNGNKGATVNGKMGAIAATNGTVYFNLTNISYTDPTIFQTAMSGVQLVYELVTPTIYPLTPGQVKTLLGVNNIWSNTGDINSVTYSKSTSGLINTYDKVKLNSLATVSLTGNYNDLLNKPDLSVYLTTIPTMVGATSSAAGTAGLTPAPTSADVDKFLAGDGTYKSGGLPMVILSYGNSTWAEFEAAYNNNVIVYTRASSNSNPATGSQTRMAFMAYVNNATTPTEVEFQYYRSMSSHSATAMGDQVFVYKLTKTGGWSVTSRDASIKQIKVDTNDPGTVSWSGNVVTLKSGLPKVTASDNGKILQVVNGAWAAVSPE